MSSSDVVDRVSPGKGEKTRRLRKMREDIDAELTGRSKRDIDTESTGSFSVGKNRSVGRQRNSTRISQANITRGKSLTRGSEAPVGQERSLTRKSGAPILQERRLARKSFAPVGRERSLRQKSETPVVSRQKSSAPVALNRRKSSAWKSVAGQKSSSPKTFDRQNSSLDRRKSKSSTQKNLEKQQSSSSEKLRRQRSVSAKSRELQRSVSAQKSLERRRSVSSRKSIEWQRNRPFLKYSHAESSTEGNFAERREEKYPAPWHNREDGRTEISGDTNEVQGMVELEEQQPLHGSLEYWWRENARKKGLLVNGHAIREQRRGLRPDYLKPKKKPRVSRPTPVIIEQTSLKTAGQRKMERVWIKRRAATRIMEAGRSKYDIHGFYLVDNLATDGKREVVNSWHPNQRPTLEDFEVQSDESVSGIRSVRSTSLITSPIALSKTQPPASPSHKTEATTSVNEEPTVTAKSVYADIRQGRQVPQSKIKELFLPEGPTGQTGVRRLKKPKSKFDFLPPDPQSFSGLTAYQISRLGPLRSLRVAFKNNAQLFHQYDIPHGTVLENQFPDAPEEFREKLKEEVAKIQPYAYQHKLFHRYIQEVCELPPALMVYGLLGDYALNRDEKKRDSCSMLNSDDNEDSRNKIVHEALQWANTLQSVNSRSPNTRTPSGGISPLTPPLVPSRESDLSVFSGIANVVDRDNLGAVPRIADGRHRVTNKEGNAPQGNAPHKPGPSKPSLPGSEVTPRVKNRSEDIPLEKQSDDAAVERRSEGTPVEKRSEGRPVEKRSSGSSSPTAAKSRDSNSSGASAKPLTRGSGSSEGTAVKPQDTPVEKRSENAPPVDERSDDISVAENRTDDISVTKRRSEEAPVENQIAGTASGEKLSSGSSGGSHSRPRDTTSSKPQRRDSRSSDEMVVLPRSSSSSDALGKQPVSRTPPSIEEEVKSAVTPPPEVPSTEHVKPVSTPPPGVSQNSDSGKATPLDIPASSSESVATPPPQVLTLYSKEDDPVEKRFSSNSAASKQSSGSKPSLASERSSAASKKAFSSSSGESKPPGSGSSGSPMPLGSGSSGSSDSSKFLASSAGEVKTVTTPPESVTVTVTTPPEAPAKDFFKKGVDDDYAYNESALPRLSSISSIHMAETIPENKVVSNQNDNQAVSTQDVFPQSVGRMKFENSYMKQGDPKEPADWVLDKADPTKLQDDPKFEDFATQAEREQIDAGGLGIDLLAGAMQARFNQYFNSPEAVQVVDQQVQPVDGVACDERSELQPDTVFTDSTADRDRFRNFPLEHPIQKDRDGLFLLPNQMFDIPQNFLRGSHFESVVRGDAEFMRALAKAVKKVDSRMYEMEVEHRMRDRLLQERLRSLENKTTPRIPALIHGLRLQDTPVDESKEVVQLSDKEVFPEKEIYMVLEQQDDEEEDESDIYEDMFFDNTILHDWTPAKTRPRKGSIFDEVSALRAAIGTGDIAEGIGAATTGSTTYRKTADSMRKMIRYSAALRTQLDMEEEKKVEGGSDKDQRSDKDEETDTAGKAQGVDSAEKVDEKRRKIGTQLPDKISHSETLARALEETSKDPIDSAKLNTRSGKLESPKDSAKSSLKGSSPRASSSKGSSSKARSAKGKSSDGSSSRSTYSKSRASKSSSSKSSAPHGSSAFGAAVVTPQQQEKSTMQKNDDVVTTPNQEVKIEVQAINAGSRNGARKSAAEAKQFEPDWKTKEKDKRDHSSSSKSDSKSDTHFSHSYKTSSSSHTSSSRGDADNKAERHKNKLEVASKPEKDDDKSKREEIPSLSQGEAEETVSGRIRKVRRKQRKSRKREADKKKKEHTKPRDAVVSAEDKKPPEDTKPAEGAKPIDIVITPSQGEAKPAQDEVKPVLDDTNTAQEETLVPDSKSVAAMDHAEIMQAKRRLSAIEVTERLAAFLLDEDLFDSPAISVTKAARTEESLQQAEFSEQQHKAQTQQAQVATDKGEPTLDPIPLQKAFDSLEGAPTYETIKSIKDEISRLKEEELSHVHIGHLEEILKEAGALSRLEALEKKIRKANKQSARAAAVAEIASQEAKPFQEPERAKTEADVPRWKFFARKDGSKDRAKQTEQSRQSGAEQLLEEIEDGAEKADEDEEKRAPLLAVARHQSLPKNEEPPVKQDDDSPMKSPVNRRKISFRRASLQPSDSPPPLNRARPSGTGVRSSRRGSNVRHGQNTCANVRNIEDFAGEPEFLTGLLTRLPLRDQTSSLTILSRGSTRSSDSPPRRRGEKFSGNDSQMEKPFAGNPACSKSTTNVFQERYSPKQRRGSVLKRQRQVTMEEPVVREQAEAMNREQTAREQAKEIVAWVTLVALRNVFSDRTFPTPRLSKTRDATPVSGFGVSKSRIERRKERTQMLSRRRIDHSYLDLSKQEDIVGTREPEPRRSALNVLREAVLETKMLLSNSSYSKTSDIPTTRDEVIRTTREGEKGTGKADDVAKREDPLGPKTLERDPLNLKALEQIPVKPVLLFEQDQSRPVTIGCPKTMETSTDAQSIVEETDADTPAKATDPEAPAKETDAEDSVKQQSPKKKRRAPMLNRRGMHDTYSYHTQQENDVAQEAWSGLPDSFSNGVVTPVTQEYEKLALEAATQHGAGEQSSSQVEQQSPLQAKQHSSPRVHQQSSLQSEHHSSPRVHQQSSLQAEQHSSPQAGEQSSQRIGEQGEQQAVQQVKADSAQQRLEQQLETQTSYATEEHAEETKTDNTVSDEKVTKKKKQKKQQKNDTGEQVMPDQTRTEKTVEEVMPAQKHREEATPDNERTGEKAEETVPKEKAEVQSTVFSVEGPSVSPFLGFVAEDPPGEVTPGQKRTKEETENALTAKERTDEAKPDCEGTKGKAEETVPREKAEVQSSSFSVGERSVFSSFAAFGAEKVVSGGECNEGEVEDTMPGQERTEETVRSDKPNAEHADDTAETKAEVQASASPAQQPATESVAEEPSAFSSFFGFVADSTAEVDPAPMASAHAELETAPVATAGLESTATANRETTRPSLPAAAAPESVKMNGAVTDVGAEPTVDAVPEVAKPIDVADTKLTKSEATVTVVDAETPKPELTKSRDIDVRPSQGTFDHVFSAPPVIQTHAPINSKELPWDDRKETFDPRKETGDPAKEIDDFIMLEVSKTETPGMEPPIIREAVLEENQEAASESTATNPVAEATETKAVVEATASNGTVNLRSSFFSVPPTAVSALPEELPRVDFLNDEETLPESSSVDKNANDTAETANDTVQIAKENVLPKEENEKTDENKKTDESDVVMSFLFTDLDVSRDDSRIPLPPAIEVDMMEFPLNIDSFYGTNHSNEGHVTERSSDHQEEAPQHHDVHHHDVHHHEDAPGFMIPSGMIPSEPESSSDAEQCLEHPASPRGFAPNEPDNSVFWSPEYSGLPWPHMNASEHPLSSTGFAPESPENPWKLTEASHKMLNMRMGKGMMLQLGNLGGQIATAGGQAVQGAAGNFDANTLSLLGSSAEPKSQARSPSSGAGATTGAPVNPYAGSKDESTDSQGSEFGTTEAPVYEPKKEKAPDKRPAHIQVLGAAASRVKAAAAATKGRDLAAPFRTTPTAGSGSAAPASAPAPSGAVSAFSIFQQKAKHTAEAAQEQARIAVEAAAGRARIVQEQAAAKLAQERAAAAAQVAEERAATAKAEEQRLQNILSNEAFLPASGRGVVQWKSVMSSPSQSPGSLGGVTTAKSTTKNVVSDSVLRLQSIKEKLKAPSAFNTVGVGRTTATAIGVGKSPPAFSGAFVAEKGPATVGVAAVCGQNPVDPVARVGGKRQPVPGQNLNAMLASTNAPNILRQLNKQKTSTGPARLSPADSARPSLASVGSVQLPKSPVPAGATVAKQDIVAKQTSVGGSPGVGIGSTRLSTPFIPTEADKRYLQAGIAFDPQESDVDERKWLGKKKKDEALLVETSADEQSETSEWTISGRTVLGKAPPQAKVGKKRCASPPAKKASHPAPVKAVPSDKIKSAVVEQLSIEDQKQADDFLGITVFSEPPSQRARSEKQQSVVAKKIGGITIAPASPVNAISKAVTSEKSETKETNMAEDFLGITIDSELVATKETTVATDGPKVGGESQSEPKATAQSATAPCGAPCEDRSTPINLTTKEAGQAELEVAASKAELEESVEEADERAAVEAAKKAVEDAAFAKENAAGLAAVKVAQAQAAKAQADFEFAKAHTEADLARVQEQFVPRAATTEEMLANENILFKSFWNMTISRNPRRFLDPDVMSGVQLSPSQKITMQQLQEIIDVAADVEDFSSESSDFLGSRKGPLTAVEECEDGVSGTQGDADGQAIGATLTSIQIDANVVKLEQLSKLHEKGVLSETQMEELLKLRELSEREAEKDANAKFSDGTSSWYADLSSDAPIKYKSKEEAIKNRKLKNLTKNRFPVVDDPSRWSKRTTGLSRTAPSKAFARLKIGLKGSKSSKASCRKVTKNRETDADESDIAARKTKKRTVPMTYRVQAITPSTRVSARARLYGDLKDLKKRANAAVSVITKEYMLDYQSALVDGFNSDDSKDANDAKVEGYQFHPSPKDSDGSDVSGDGADGKSDVTSKKGKEGKTASKSTNRSNRSDQSPSIMTFDSPSIVSGSKKGSKKSAITGYSDYSDGDLDTFGSKTKTKDTKQDNTNFGEKPKLEADNDGGWRDHAPGFVTDFVDTKPNPRMLFGVSAGDVADVILEGVKLFQEEEVVDEGVDMDAVTASFEPPTCTIQGVPDSSYMDDINVDEHFEEVRSKIKKEVFVWLDDLDEDACKEIRKIYLEQLNSKVAGNRNLLATRDSGSQFDRIVNDPHQLNRDVFQDTLCEDRFFNAFKRKLQTATETSEAARNVLNTLQFADKVGHQIIPLMFKHKEEFMKNVMKMHYLHTKNRLEDKILFGGKEGIVLAASYSDVYNATGGTPQDLAIQRNLNDIVKGKIDNRQTDLLVGAQLSGAQKNGPQGSISDPLFRGLFYSTQAGYKWKMDAIQQAILKGSRDFRKKTTKLEDSLPEPSLGYLNMMNGVDVRECIELDDHLQIVGIDQWKISTKERDNRTRHSMKLSDFPPHGLLTTQIVTRNQHKSAAVQDELIAVGDETMRTKLKFGSAQRNEKDPLGVIKKVPATDEKEDLATFYNEYEAIGRDAMERVELDESPQSLAKSALVEKKRGLRYFVEDNAESVLFLGRHTLRNSASMEMFAHWDLHRQNLELDAERMHSLLADSSIALDWHELARIPEPPGDPRVSPERLDEFYEKLRRKNLRRERAEQEVGTLVDIEVEFKKVISVLEGAQYCRGTTDSFGWTDVTDIKKTAYYDEYGKPLPSLYVNDQISQANKRIFRERGASPARGGSPEKIEKGRKSVTDAGASPGGADPTFQERGSKDKGGAEIAPAQGEKDVVVKEIPYLQRGDYLTENNTNDLDVWRGNTLDDIARDARVFREAQVNELKTMDPRAITFHASDSMRRIDPATGEFNGFFDEKPPRENWQKMFLRMGEKHGEEALEREAMNMEYRNKHLVYGSEFQRTAEFTDSNIREVEPSNLFYVTVQVVEIFHKDIHGRTRKGVLSLEKLNESVEPGFLIGDPRNKKPGQGAIRRHFMEHIVRNSDRFTNENHNVIARKRFARPGAEVFRENCIGLENDNFTYRYDVRSTACLERSVNSYVDADGTQVFPRGGLTLPRQSVKPAPRNVLKSDRPGNTNSIFVTNTNGKDGASNVGVQKRQVFTARCSAAYNSYAQVIPLVTHVEGRHEATWIEGEYQQDALLESDPIESEGDSSDGVPESPRSEHALEDSLDSPTSAPTHYFEGSHRMFSWFFGGSKEEKKEDEVDRRESAGITAPDEEEAEDEEDKSAEDVESSEAEDQESIFTHHERAGAHRERTLLADILRHPYDKIIIKNICVNPGIFLRLRVFKKSLDAARDDRDCGTILVDFQSYFKAMGSSGTRFFTVRKRGAIRRLLLNLKVGKSEVEHSKQREYNPGKSNDHDFFEESVKEFLDSSSSPFAKEQSPSQEQNSPPPDKISRKPPLKASNKAPPKTSSSPPPPKASN